MTNRGMKKFAPFASLIEQSTCLEAMRYEKNKVPKPELSEDQQEKINNILTNYDGNELEFKYFCDGYIYSVVDKIVRIDTYKRAIILTKGTLEFSRLVDINTK